MENLNWDDAEKLFEELVKAQEDKLMQCGERLVPHITRDDLLQPNDYPILENHPHFRYEEGVIEGLRTAYTALRLMIQEKQPT